jgi:hypothetical protein
MLEDVVEWDDVKLTHRCDCARNLTAEARNWTTDPTCGHCHGSGHYPTEYGSAILELVRVHGGSK